MTKGASFSHHRCMIVLVRVLQWNRTTKPEFSSLSSGGWESHNLPCSQWRTRKGSGMIQSESEVLRTGSTGSRAGAHGCSSGRESKFTPPVPFCSIQARNGLCDACPHWEGLFITQSTDHNTRLFQKHPHGRNQKQYFISYLGIL